MNSNLINTLLWVSQGFLAATFLIAGSTKLLQPPEKVAQLVPGSFPLPFLRALGALEILGALGVMLPLTVGVVPILTPLASLCMAVVLAAAGVVHVKWKRTSTLPMLLFLLALAVVVTIGRYPVDIAGSTSHGGGFPLADTVLNACAFISDFECNQVYVLADCKLPGNGLTL